MSYEPRDLVAHILVETAYLIEATAGVSRERYFKDETLQRAFARSLSVFGEAAKRIPSDFKNRYPEVEWRSMAGLRDRLVHDYFGIDQDIVWEIVQQNVPLLSTQLARIRAENE